MESYSYGILHYTTIPAGSFIFFTTQWYKLECLMFHTTSWSENHTCLHPGAMAPLDSSKLSIAIRAHPTSPWLFGREGSKRWQLATRFDTHRYLFFFPRAYYPNCLLQSKHITETHCRKRFDPKVYVGGSRCFTWTGFKKNRLPVFKDK